MLTHDRISHTVRIIVLWCVYVVPMYACMYFWPWWETTRPISIKFGRQTVIFPRTTQKCTSENWPQTHSLPGNREQETYHKMRDPNVSISSNTCPNFFSLSFLVSIVM